MWELNIPLPRPVGDWLSCPVCDSADWLVTSWHRFWRSDQPPFEVTHASPGRCDVVVKCLACSHVWVHGLALSAEQMNEHPNLVGQKVYWNELDLLRGE